MIELKRKNMILTVGLFALVTFILTVVFAVTQQKSGLSFEKVTIPQLAPAFALLIMFLIYKSIPEKINLDMDSQIMTKSFIAIIIPFLLFGLTYFVGKQMNLNIKITDNLSKLLPLMITGMIIGAVGEELGWRSYLQPLLQQKNSILISSIIVGIIWGLWHIGHYKNGIVFMTGFLMFTISASIFIAWLLQGTEYNLIISALFHLIVNICFLVFFHNSMTDSKYMLINGIVWLIPTVGIILFTGKDLIKT